MKKFLSLLRNIAHIGSGVMLFSPDPTLQIVGGVLALLATTGSQFSAKPPKLDGVPLKIQPLTGEVIAPIPHPLLRRAPADPLLCLALAGLVAFTGCATVEDGQASIENKAYIVTKVVVTKVLQNNPGNAALLAGFEMARGDLQILMLNETIGVKLLVEILDRLPADMLDGDTGLYIEASLLFFADELSAVAIRNPIEVRAAAAGMIRALDKILGPQAPPPPLAVPI